MGAGLPVAVVVAVAALPSPALAALPLGRSLRPVLVLRPCDFNLASLPARSLLLDLRLDFYLARFLTRLTLAAAVAAAALMPLTRSFLRRFGCCSADLDSDLVRLAGKSRCRRNRGQRERSNGRGIQEGYADHGGHSINRAATERRRDSFAMRFALSRR